MKLRSVGALAAGFALDLALGDPPNWPHPVRVIGKQIEFEEKLVRWYVLPHDGAQMGEEPAGPVFGKVFPAADDVEPLAETEGWPLDRATTEQLAGAAVAADVMMVAPLATWGLLKIADRIHPALAFGVETLLFYQLIATRGLRDASMEVHDELERGDLPAARTKLGYIVGRDTAHLDESEVARAAVETVAENASDGVIAPLLYQAIGGAPMTMLYKAVNTLDSMLGYKNDRYLNFGRASALIDDAFNIVPARLTGLLMCAAAPLVGQNGARAFKVFKRDRHNHLSPNSAHGEAACAGALEVQLGGPNYYGGKLVEKPTIGDDVRPVEPEDIRRANKLLYATAALGAAACSAVGLLCVLSSRKK